MFDFSSQKLLFNPLFILRTIFLKPPDGADILTVFHRAEGKLHPNCSVLQQYFECHDLTVD